MNQTQSTAYAALIMRLSLGIMFIAHAALKIWVFTPAGTVAYFESLGLPGFFAYLTIAAEMIGGILLVIGLQVRIVAAALIPILLGALFLGHGSNGWVFSNEGGGWEYPAFLVAASIVQVLLGNGAFSLSKDHKTTA